MLRRLIDSPWTYFAGAGLLLLVAVASQFDLRIPSRAEGDVSDVRELADRDDLNVVFILVDTLRADRIGVYGYERNTTPIIDDLASHGIVFENVIAQSSWTKTSMASIWTGTNPARNGILRFNHVVPSEVAMPAEIFEEAGYRTAGIWRNGWVAPNFGFAQGFDVYFKPRPGRKRGDINRLPITQHPVSGTDEDAALSVQDFLDNFGREKFFLYLHLMDLHQYVFDDRAEAFGPSYSDAYDKSLSWTDRVIGAVVQSLDDAGVLARTLVVISSDHGEAFMEHGFEGHARNLYWEVTEVPLILIPPFILDPGIRVDARVANIDIWPTLLDLAGLPPLSGADGRSLVPLILEAGGGPASTDDLRDRVLISHLDQRWGNGQVDPVPVVSVIEDDSRLFVHLTDHQRDEFYDLAADPRETNNILAENPPELDELRAEVHEYLASSDPEAPPTIELDQMRLNQLKALGYRVAP